MSQHDYIIANQTRTSFRSDLNDALAAIATNNSAATEPTTTYSYQFWADTTTGLLKQRNAANTAWITLFTLASGVADKATANTFLAAQNFAKGANVASAATTNIWATDGNLIHVTGTIGITSLGTAAQAGASRTVMFDGIVTLTHNASTLVLPGGSNYTTSANEVIEFIADTTTKIVMKARSSLASTATRIAFSVHRNGVAQSITPDGSGYATVLFTTEDYDIGGCFSSYKFTPTVEDIYHICFAIKITSSNSAVKGASIRKNGFGGTSIASTDVIVGTTSSYLLVEKDVYMNGTTDFLEFWATFTSITGGSIVGSSNYTYATGHRTYAY